MRVCIVCVHLCTLRGTAPGSFGIELKTGTIPSVRAIFFENNKNRCKFYSKSYNTTAFIVIYSDTMYTGRKRIGWDECACVVDTRPY